MAGPDGELDWHFQTWNEEIAKAVSEQLSNSDTILLGRVTYNAMASYWSSRPIDMQAPREDIDFAEMMNNHTKIVFSRTLPAVGWNNTRLASGDIMEEITTLKQQEGKDIIIYGSGEIVAALTELGLIDEYRIWVHPVAIGRGRPLFSGLYTNLTLKLLKIRTFSSGVILLYYHHCCPVAEMTTPPLQNHSSSLV